MPNALKISQLVKSYQGNQVVKSIDLEIESGEMFGLLGPNGAGKSTTINMVVGVTNIESGKIAVFGHDNQSDYITTRRLTGVMHQEIVIDTFFTIEQALKMHAGYYGVKDDPKWRERLIDRLALGPHLKKPMNKLSGGMKRRFMVAKALIHKPRLLILDEPTAGVDVELRTQLWDFVREINRKDGVTVLLTTHYLEEAEEMCGRIGIMNLGKIVALEKTPDLINKLDEKRLTIQLKEKIKELPLGLQKFKSKLEADGEKIVFQIDRSTNAGDVMHAVHNVGLTVCEIETAAPSLQDVFLKLTAGSHAQ